MTDISVILPVKLSGDDEWMIELSEFAVNTMRMHTKKKFELIILESGGKELKGLADVHIRCQSESNYVRDFNSGIEIASGKYIVQTAADILVGPDWLDALQEPFDRFHDCGASCISMLEDGRAVGMREPGRSIVEGIYGPLMMFRAGWNLDEAFSGLHADSDLIMRIYQAGMRSYRNHRSIGYRLNALSCAKPVSEKIAAERQREADMLFKARYKESPLWMARMIMNRRIEYGREHES